MEMTKNLNSLFNAWEKETYEYKGKFVKDGIIDESKYNIAPKKLLFIAKEPNDPEQSSWDFRDYWKKEFKYSFSYRIAEWAYGILNKFNTSYDELQNIRDILHETLLNIAFMNIKKCGGKGTSNKSEIISYYKKNRQYILKEIEIIDPDIIILCLSFCNDIRNDLFPDYKWEKSGYNIYIAKLNDIKVVDYYHPSVRFAPSATYCLLKNVFQSNNLLMPK